MTNALFAESLERVIGHDLDVTALIDTAEKLTNAGERHLVAELYRVWLQYNPNHPLWYAVHFNHGVVLENNGELVAAWNAWNHAITANPLFFSSYFRLGESLERAGAITPAVQCWQTAVWRLATCATTTGLDPTQTHLQQVAITKIQQLATHTEEALQHTLDSLRPLQTTWQTTNQETFRSWDAHAILSTRTLLAGITTDQTRFPGV